VSAVKAIEITTAAGNVIRLTGKTLTLNGTRRGYLIPGHDYHRELAFRPMAIPYTTGANGTGTRRIQLVCTVASGKGFNLQRS